MSFLLAAKMALRCSGGLDEFLLSFFFFCFIKVFAQSRGVLSKNMHDNNTMLQCDLSSGTLLQLRVRL